MTATFTKLQSGEWGVRVAFKTPSSVSPGTTVTVTKKNGDEQQVVIGKVLWHDATTYVCEIEESGGNEKQASSKPRHGCICTEPGCCRPRCRCDRTCNCRGGNIYNC